MAITTTYSAIRDNYITKITAIVPTLLSDKPFNSITLLEQPLRDWAARFPTSAAFRRFEIIRDGDVEDPPYFDPTALERNEGMLISVAYPVELALYGRDNILDIETTMRVDARLIRDVVFSGGNYLAGQSAGFVKIRTPDRSNPKVWFQDFGVTLIYTEGQTLT